MVIAQNQIIVFGGLIHGAMTVGFFHNRKKAKVCNAKTWLADMNEGMKGLSKMDGVRSKNTGYFTSRAMENM